MSRQCLLRLLEHLPIFDAEALELRHRQVRIEWQARAKQQSGSSSSLDLESKTKAKKQLSFHLGLYVNPVSSLSLLPKEEVLQNLQSISSPRLFRHQYPAEAHGRPQSQIAPLQRFCPLHLIEDDTSPGDNQTRHMMQ